MILDGDNERPLGMDAVLIRRLSRLDACRDEVSYRDDEDEDDVFVFPGMSRMLSLRPVVGSVVWSRAGSCET